MRESVQIFAEDMERVLQENDEDKGQEGWLSGSCSVRFLLHALKEEVEELEEALTECVPGAVGKECLDVANFAMMIRHRVWENNRIKGEN